MRRVVYSVAMSLDGYIAGPTGEADWIVMDPEIDFTALMARFDTVLMGRKTFETAGGGGGTPGVTSVVVSRTLRPADHPGVTVIGDDVGGAVAKLRRAAGKDIWLFGGGSLFRSLLDLGQVDAVEVGVIPVLLGGGVPLVPPGARAKLKLVNSRALKATGTVCLEYAVEPPKKKRR
ncbi:dihydrofolate reductase [bacterium]|nr:dihydrofolate reductase [bacterium]